MSNDRRERTSRLEEVVIKNICEGVQRLMQMASDNDDAHNLIKFQNNFA